MRTAFIVAALAALAIAGPATAFPSDSALKDEVASEASTTGPAGTNETRRVARGFKIAPVPLDLAGKNRTLVGLGSYLVNAGGGCNDCHTNPPYAEGGDPFAGEPEKINTSGYLAGGTPFGPGLVSANLTPDAAGLPGGMTFPEFFRALRFGADPDEPGRLLQVMPWPVYGNLTARDIRAVYEYLRSIPSITPTDGGETSPTVAR